MLRRARQLPVGAAVFAWLTGLYALPLAHNIQHRNDHSHGPSPAGHAHAHEEPHSHPHPRDTDDRVPLDSDHGTGSVLHFAAAAVESHRVELPQAGPRALLPAPPAPRVAASIPARIVFVRGPPLIDLH
jgi:hypothetical protein